MDMALHKKIIPIIILDDAHFLRNENFFELQLLSNFNFDSLSPALFILIAQPHLLERLRRPAFDSFYQRISIKINLQPLSSQETHQFVLHVLKNASDASGSSNSNHVSASNEHLFTPKAIELIFKRSGGIPRIITIIMEQALIYGSAQKLTTIDEEVIYKIEPEL